MTFSSQATAPPFDEGDEAFVAELTAIQASLHSFVGSLMPGDPACDDVVQRANLTLWRKRESFRVGTNFRAWAFEVAKWTVRSHFKDVGRKQWLIFDDELAEKISDRMDELTASRVDERQAVLRECLEKLRPIDRDLLLSHYEVGDSLQQCAARAGRSAAGLKVTFFRLRAGLRRCIVEQLRLDRLQQSNS